MTQFRVWRLRRQGWELSMNAKRAVKKSSVGVWLRRPRRSFWETFPPFSWFIQGVFAFPFICLVFVLGWVFGGTKPESLPLLIAFAALAPLEIAFLLMWLRRPVDRSSGKTGAGKGPANR